MERKRDLKRKTEILVIAAQNNAIRTKRTANLGIEKKELKRLIA